MSAPEFGRGPKSKGNIGNVVHFARLTDAEIVLTYCTRVGDAAHFWLTFSPSVEQVRTADEQADFAANVATLDRLIAPIIRDHLDQWYYALQFDFAPNKP